MLSEWKALGDPEPSGLVDARVQIHHVVRHLAGLANAYLGKKEDDHPFTWSPELGGLVGPAIGGAGGGASGAAGAQRKLRLGLNFAELIACVVDGKGKATDTFPLDGRTLAELDDWLTEQAAERGLKGAPRKRDHEGLPEHAIAKKGTLQRGDGEAFAELARWYGDASWMLEALRADTPGTTEVVVSPDDLRIAVVIEKSVGVGLSPGDATTKMPYFYVIATSGSGEWKLTGTEIVKDGTSEGQLECVRRFLQSSIRTCEGQAAKKK